MFNPDVGFAENAVNKYVKVPLTQNQYDALVSFVYNLGEGNFRKSTLLKELNFGNYKGVADWFDDYVNVYIQKNGRKVRQKGDRLATRRTEEKELFLKD